MLTPTRQNARNLAGISVLVGALADPSKRKLPAIALTAWSSTTDRDTVLLSGFQRFMAKPFDAELLVETIANAASLNRNAA